MSTGECECGCSSFRFKWRTDVVEDEQVFANICANCDHTLAAHLEIRKQSE